MRRITGWWLMALALLVLACSDEGPSGVEEKVAAVRLTPAQVSVAVGDTAEVHAVALTADGIPVEVARVDWSVSGGDVALISGSGRTARLVGRRAGLVTLRAAIAEVSANALVQVDNTLPQISAIAPMLVQAGAPGVTLTVRGSAFVEGSVVLVGGAARPTTYVSETLLVAELPAADVSDVGTTEIRVQNPLPGGGTSPERQVFTVVARGVAHIEISRPSLALSSTDTAHLTARVRDAQGVELPGRPVAWSTSNATVAQVSTSGVVTAYAAGAAVITAASEGVSASIPVTVAAAALPRITSLSPDTASIGRVVFRVRGQNFARNAAVFALNRTQPTEWLSGSELEVTLWEEDTRVARTFDVRVINPVGQWSNAVSFTIKHTLMGVRVALTGESDLFPGETAQLNASALDERNEPLPGNFAVTWRSTNAAIASVNAAGLVTAHATGTVYVEAEIAGRRSGVQIEVLAPVQQWDLLYEGSVNGVSELFVARVDGSGTRTRLLPGVRASDPTATIDGSRIAFVGVDATGNQDIYVVNRDGTNLRRLTTHPAVDDQPAWSPDGVLLTFRSRREGYSDIWVMRSDGGEQTNITDGNVFRDYLVNERPTFNAVGSRVVFSQTSTMFGPVRTALVAARLDGTDARYLTSLEEGRHDREAAFSANHQRLAVRRTMPNYTDQLTFLDPDTGEAYGVIFPAGVGFTPAWTPNGEWLAFMAKDRGADGIYITRPNATIRRQVVPLGRNPSWIRR